MGSHPRANCGNRSSACCRISSTGNPHPRANCGIGSDTSGTFGTLAIHTHARIAGPPNLGERRYYYLAIHTHARIAGQFVCNCKGCRGLRTCILFRIGFENGENTASPAIRRGNTFRRPFTDGGGTHCLRRAWSVWDMPCPSMVCEGKGK